MLKFGDVSYNLYSHSFLQFGLVSCMHICLSIICYDPFVELHIAKFHRSIEKPAPYRQHILCSFKCTLPIILYVLNVFSDSICRM